MEITTAPFLKLEGKVPERIPVYSLEGKKLKEIETPKVFYTPVRKDLILKVFLALRTSRLQPKGVDPLAGKRTTAESWGVGYGVARVPRIKGSTRAAFVPQAVGGRRFGAPTTLKRIRERINRVEKRLALASAIAATAIKEIVRTRGHRIPEKIDLPIVLEDRLEEIDKTKKLREVLKKLTLWSDIERARKGVKIRAGKGKMRGRRYKVPKSILLVVTDTENIRKAARNLVGVDVVNVHKLNVELLAPGGHPGRLTVWTESAVKTLAEKFG
ncbi:MAG: 50S ribosomal protein L4 [Thermoprotei archaeon]|nr:MAG: 50S ribosomal protein L4 [Thermoprotei archaeon]